VVHDEAELRERVKEIVGRYDQPALVEEYILGREFTVGLLGERRPRVLPAMEVVFTDPSDTHPVYSFEHKLAESVKVRYECPAKLEPAQARALERAAREVFSALGCRDVARMDFRMDAQGRMYFIECNPLPGLTPGWSDLVLIAKAAGMQYRDVIGELLSFAIRRYKERQRERREAARREALSSSPLADAPPATNGPRNGGAAGVS
jgi:D-alanine-D-alanine ligase